MVQVFPDDRSLLSVPVGPLVPGLLWGQVVPVGVQYSKYTEM